MSTLNTFLAIPAVKAAFDFLAKIFGTFSALGLAFGAAAFGFKVVAGNILFLASTIGKLTGIQTLATLTTGGFTAKLYAMSAAAFKAVGGGLLALAKAIGGFTAKLYAMSAAAFTAVGGGLLALAKAIGGAFVTALKGGAAALRVFGLALAANPVGAILLAVGLLVAGFALLYDKSETFRNAVNTLFEGLKNIIRNVIEWLKENWKDVLAILTGPLGTAILVISENWDKITAGIKSFVSRAKSALGGLWNGLIDGLKTAWGNAKIWWNTNVASKKLKIGGATVLGKTLPSFTLGFPGLAEGGIISPSAGGTLARIGEAGRAERVEPLDPDGLSKRDKAMIQMLSGGAGGMTINVYPSQGMNESELANMVSRQIAFQLRRGGA